MFYLLSFHWGWLVGSLLLGLAMGWISVVQRGNGTSKVLARWLAVLVAALVAASLARVIPAVIDRPPGMPIDPKVKEFLRYLLSREGQQIVVRDGRYLPLSAVAAQKEVRKLD